MSSQTLITGATGFIGRQLTRDLVARGERVRVFARDGRKARNLFGDNVEIMVGDVTDPGSVAAACQGVKTAYHIAGGYRFGLRHRRPLWRTNVEGTENVLSSAAEAGVERVVHLGSAGVLAKSGPLDPESPLINENDYPASAPCLSAYKSSKWHSEQRALAWARRGLPVVIASTTCPIGPGDEIPTPTGQIIRDFLQRRFPCYCRTGLNFIGVADLSLGLQRVAESGQPGERYLLCAENLWLKEFLDLLSDETSLPAPRVCLPSAAIRLIGCAGELLDLLHPRSKGARVCLETAFQSDRVQFFSNARARDELGWKPLTSVRENIREAVAWYRSETSLEILPAVEPSVEPHVP